MLTLNDKSLPRSRNFIDGEWVAGGAGTIDVTNPANGQIEITTANGDVADAERAVEAAAEAFKSWSRVPAKQRAILLRNRFNLLMENEDEVIERANDTDYGLAAYYFTRDIGRVFRVAEYFETKFHSMGGIE